MVTKLYPQYKYYSKKDTILASSHKHKRFKLDNPNAKGEYPEMETKLETYIMQLRDCGVCVSSFMIKVEAMRILREQYLINNVECHFRASDG